DITAGGGRAVAVKGDVSRAAEAQGIVDAAVRNFGRLDVLVNNSGVYEFAPIEAGTEEAFRRMVDVNVLGLLLTTQAAVRHLGEGASVINIGSAATRITPPQTAVYTGTKGGGGRGHRGAGQGAGAAGDPGQRDQPRDGRDRGDGGRRGHRVGL